MSNQWRPTGRSPLGDATARVNNSSIKSDIHPLKSSPIPHHESLYKNGLLQPHPKRLRSPPPNNSHAIPRVSLITQDIEEPKSNRNSQISTTSTNTSSSKVKQCIGPWRLGKTLGRGATARVRLARNIYTSQEAAVKIVLKNSAQLSQAGSLAALDRAESQLPLEVDGLRRMPIGIEREIAIMKLIQHPNIIGLYDIWENHSEIYLVLEYVDNGELFTHITENGKLEEEEAIKYFRQILSAVGYCHSFNICHRDLKPENILLTKSGKIKIADFGMAALHQSPDHHLDTSCGSPHYAAPELIKGGKYKGNQVDVWSMGVVLFATLAGRLPFDVDGSSIEWLTPLLLKIRKGQYDMPQDISYEAQCLIWSMLQVDPTKRIALSQIWKHPLLTKYDYLDNLGEGIYPQSPSAKAYGGVLLKKSDIQRDIVRCLRSMWHKLSEQEIIDALLSEEPNDQQLFYALLRRYQDTILENYQGDLAYSSSDYHHVRPAFLTKTYSTCHFPQDTAKGHGRNSSKFTVISNVAETERSYDPFKASRPQRLNGRDNGLKITVHGPENGRLRVPSSAKGDAGLRQNSYGSSTASRNASGNLQAFALRNRIYASRSSIASSTRSRSSGLRPTIGHGKRGISFNHSRRSLNSDSRNCIAANANGQHSTFTGNTSADIMKPIHSTSDSTQYIRSKKSLTAAEGGKRTSCLWNEDVRKLSSTLARDCDEAFNRTTILEEMETTQNEVVEKSALSQQNMLRVQEDAIGIAKKKRGGLATRPLPPAPARTASVKAELLEARKQAQYRQMFDGDVSPGYLNRLVTHIDRLIQPISPTRSLTDRRTASAPNADTRQFSSGAGRHLPSIYEQGGEDSSPHRLPLFTESKNRATSKHGRVTSAPEAPSVWETMQTLTGDNLERQYHLMAKDTIRVVPPSSPLSPVRPPAPLNIRKKSSLRASPPQSAASSMACRGTKSERLEQSDIKIPQGSHGSNEAVMTPNLEQNDENTDTSFGNPTIGVEPARLLKKKSSWFKRNSKTSSDGDGSASEPGNEYQSSKGSQETMKAPYERSSDARIPRPGSFTPIPVLPQKKKVSFNPTKWLIKKRLSQTDMAIGQSEFIGGDDSPRDSLVQNRYSNGKRAEVEDGRGRNIAPQRNWLAKLFNVKPASRCICFTVSKIRARQEIVSILKDWRRYGIQDLQVDKSRNIVFGKVAAENFFDMKGVAFAGEIMTIIEHGKRIHLSVARFTQEQGAASSFHKVVDTLEVVFRGKNILVADEVKKKRMVKTVASASF